MQFSIATIALFAAAVVASPTERRAECSQSNEIKSCCTPAGNPGGILGLGVQCVAISALDILSQSCTGNGRVNCCTTNQAGLINVGGIGCSIL